MTPDSRTAFLEARDAREECLQRALAQARSRDQPTVVMISTNIPGPHKLRPGISRLVRAGTTALGAGLPLEPVHVASDLLGPYALALAALPPRAGKRLALAVETATPWGRLLDLDVYSAEGAPFGRADLDLPPRSCYLCAAPARDCGRFERHAASDLARHVDRLLEPFLPSLGPIRPAVLAEHLVRGARLELELTPKPGLVDRHDPGAHADLSFDLMGASIAMMPRYFADLLGAAERGAPLAAAVLAGQAAEARMVQAIRTNAHKGYLFLSGLVLWASCHGDGGVPALRAAIARLGAEFFRHAEPPQDSVRSRFGLGGIRAEAEQGLPAVFEAGWPQYQEALAAGWGPERAGHYLMAVLMQRVEDTTTLRRGGLAGLARLRQDGARLQRLMEQQRDPGPLLADLNAEYVRLGLTMGGVADCMAVTFALQGSTLNLGGEGG